MTSDKNQKLRINRPWLKSLSAFFALTASILSLNLIFTNKTYALFVPSLSASINESALVIRKGNNPAAGSPLQEASANLTVNTNDKSGYRILMSTDSADTALTNSNTSVTDKINSISGVTLLSSFFKPYLGIQIRRRSCIPSDRTALKPN